MSFALCEKDHSPPTRIQVRARPKPTCFQGRNRPHMALVLCNHGVCPRRIKRIRLVDPGETYFDPARTFRPNPNSSHFRATSSALSARQRNCAAFSIERPDSIAALRSSISISVQGAVVDVHSQILPDTLEERMPDFAFGRFAAVFDFSRQRRHGPDDRDARFSCAGPALAGLTKPPRRRMPGHRRR
jgi:hypothetical protein